MTTTRTTNKKPWQRENEKLKAYGFKWRKLFDPERWQLYDKDGTPVTKKWALQYIETVQDWKLEEAMSKCPTLSWVGLISGEVYENTDIVAIYQEGESYVIFPEGTRVEPDASYDRRTPQGKAKAHEWDDDIGRYILPNGAVFIFDGTMLRYTLQVK